MLTKKSLLIVLFCYNRARELKNAINSINKHVNGVDVALFDDDSNDVDTINVINEHYNNFVCVYRGTDKTLSDQKCGGLYSNMQRAYEYAWRNDYKYVYFIQDDMQIVRNLNDNVLAEYDDIFKSDSRITQIDPRFLREEQSGIYDSNIKAYWLKKRPHFAASGFFDLNKLKEKEFHFIVNKQTSYKLASEKDLIRVCPYTPITMHIPFPELYRKKTIKNETIKVAQRGVWHYKDLSAEAINGMDFRDPQVLPYARTCLQISGGKFINLLYNYYPDQLIYGGGMSLPHYFAQKYKKTIKSFFKKARKKILYR